MPDKPLDIDMDRADSAKKLIYSTLSAWEVEGAAGISVRTLAAAAGLAVSTICAIFTCRKESARL